MENQKLINSAIVGGTVSALLFSIPFLNVIVNCFCCAGIMCGGIVALVYYDRSFEIREYISPASALTVGLVSGIAGAFISILIDGIIFIIFGNWKLELVNILNDTLSDMPEMTESMDEMLYEMQKEAEKGFYLGKILIELVRNLILLPIFSVAGALIARIFLNKNR
jgi:hypothetical protein